MFNKIISYLEPLNQPTGRIWVKPDLSGEFSTFYTRLGSSWVETGTTTSFKINFAATTILINGVDVTDHIKIQEGEVSDKLTKEVDMYSFTTLSSFPFKPQGGMELLEFQRINGGDPVLTYGGMIMDGVQEEVGFNQYVWKVNAPDYSQLLNRVQIVESYTNQTVGYIAKDIITRYCPELGTYYIEDGPVIDYIPFNWKYPFECLTELCKQTGRDFYVDYERNVRLFAVDANPAPYVLTDDPADAQYNNLVIGFDNSQLINVQTARGGWKLGNLYTQDTKAAYAGQTEFPILWKPFTPVTFYINGLAQELGIENVDKSGKQFVINQADKVIKCMDHAAMAGTETWYVTYKKQIPISTTVKDQDSINAAIAIEGGTGIYEGVLISDETLTTDDATAARAQQIVDDNSNPLVSGSFTTFQYGYRSGQMLAINSPLREINDLYIIREVRRVPSGIGKYQYTVSFSTKLKGLAYFLMYLFDQGKKVNLREDEELLKLEGLSDAASVSDIVPVWEKRDIDLHPAVWCNDAGTTPDKVEWSFAQWG